MTLLDCSEPSTHLSSPVRTRGDGQPDQIIGQSNEVRWGPETKLPGYTMDRSMRIRGNDFLSRNESLVVT
jgi:hypothetical protein